MVRFGSVGSGHSKGLWLRVTPSISRLVRSNKPSLSWVKSPRDRPKKNAELFSQKTANMQLSLPPSNFVIIWSLITNFTCLDIYFLRRIRFYHYFFDQSSFWLWDFKLNIQNRGKKILLRCRKWNSEEVLYRISLSSWKVILQVPF